MPPTLALLLWLILLLALLRFDRATEPGISLALWVPVTWLFILGSRLPSQWLGIQGGRAAEALEEGNSLDRTVYLVLIFLAIGILMSRSFEWGDFFSRNVALVTFLSFALLSVLWSDFPFITLKRWFRDFGNYLVILVALSDPRPAEAVSALLRRLFFLLIPLSILLIKYFPQLSIGYNYWTGVAEYVGAATSKNMLGAMCLVSGLFFFWDTVTRWADRKERRTKKIILVNVAFIIMTLWVLNLARSATSQVCLAIGCLVIAAAHSKVIRRHPTFVTVLIPLCVCLYMLLEYGLGVNVNTGLAAVVGRDPTLTDRTKIWAVLLSMPIQPLIGTGYESFWLGSRIEYIWLSSGVGVINEAHNGYLEVYLNLGIIGLFLLGAFLIASYRYICRAFTSASRTGLLALALWTVLMFYDVTESAFRGGLVWCAFLLGAITVRARTEDPIRVAVFDNAETTDQFPAVT